MEPVLLHICCGPCATACIERLRAGGREPVLFFSNGNIFPREEYERRRDTARDLAARCGCAFVEDEGARHEDWLAEVAKGHESDPEGGERCRRCFEFSLRRAAAYAQSHGLALFTTSLTVSPHKNSPLVFAAGRAAGGDHFLEENFKKKNGFLRSVQLAKEFGLYRQDYCGCEFSLASRGKTP